MKIISNFKDYYDSMRCYSMCSDDFMYIRKSKEYQEGNPRYDEFRTISENSQTFKYTIDRFIVGFCGKFYSGYIVTKPSTVRSIAVIIGIYYDIKDAVTKATNNKYVNKIQKKGRQGSSRFTIANCNRGQTLKATESNILKYMVKMETKWFNARVKELTAANIFKTHNTPYFVYTHLTSSNGHAANIIINPELRKFEFFKVFEGHRCYQELEMYLGNELLQKNNAPQIIDDKVKIQQHGFDLKSSFRKAPTKHNKG